MRIGLDVEGMDLYEDAGRWLEEIQKRAERELTVEEEEFISTAIAFIITGLVGRFTVDGKMDVEKFRKHLVEEQERAIALIHVTFNLLGGVIAGEQPEHKIKKAMEDNLRQLVMHRKKR